MSRWDDLSEHRKRRIVTHEAGHTVAAHVGGLDIDHVCATSGTTQLTEGEFRDLTDERVQLYYASGAAAEVLVFGSYHPSGVKDDKRMLAAAEDLLRDRRDDHVERDFDSYVSGAVKVLASSKDKISAVANALLATHRLTGDDVDRILEA